MLFQSFPSGIQVFYPVISYHFRAPSFCLFPAKGREASKSAGKNSYRQDLTDHPLRLVESGGGAAAHDAGGDRLQFANFVAAMLLRNSWQRVR